MIELRNYALTNQTRATFELCKSILSKLVENYPSARSVIQQYTAVPDPHNMPSMLCNTQYTDDYVDKVNGLITELTHSDTPEKLIANFDKLIDINLSLI